MKLIISFVVSSMFLIYLIKYSDYENLVNCMVITAMVQTVRSLMTRYLFFPFFKQEPDQVRLLFFN